MIILKYKYVPANVSSDNKKCEYGSEHEYKHECKRKYQNLIQTQI